MEFQQETEAKGEVKKPTKTNSIPLPFENVPSSRFHTVQETDQAKLLHEIRYCYFAKALKNLKTLIQDLPAKPSVYLLSYEQEPKETKKLLKRLYKDLKQLWGKKNIVCLV